MISFCTIVADATMDGSVSSKEELLELNKLVSQIFHDKVEAVRIPFEKGELIIHTSSQRLQKEPPFKTNWKPFDAQAGDEEEVTKWMDYSDKRGGNKVDVSFMRSMRRY